MMSEAKMKHLAEGAKRASFDLAVLSPAKKNAALVRMAVAIERDTKAILAGNDKDVRAAKARGISGALLSRLLLDSNKVSKMAEGIRQVASLPDPVGRLLERADRPNGLSIEKISVPLGVLLIIFESRPNVTADCAALAVKSGNAVILKGGSEAIHSNRAIHASIKRALIAEKIDPACVQLVDSTDRRDVDSLLRLNSLIDVVIPRGGETLIRRVTEISRIPVIKHSKGEGKLRFRRTFLGDRFQNLLRYFSALRITGGSPVQMIAGSDDIGNGSVHQLLNGDDFLFENR